ncbi:MAG: 2-amino-4-hydroxy-6-hydroxymethyldihydropteridine diphosphokinase [Candidatus Thermoplasmatota archaeon]|nr:2-amino-4-hydroxy-6-hydroxymethyldihydropteridine diphosphokinase [Candidatus Thermoplasmatota archaeon]
MQKMRYYLALGTNDGDKENNIKRAIDALKSLGEIKKASSFHTTKPWGYEEQEDFLNAAIEIESNLEPEDMLRAIKGIEQKLGRKRTFRWGPRIIDIDILLCFDGEKEIHYEDEELTIPHRNLCDRDFYLLCLKDLGVTRVCGKDIDDLLSDLG